MVTAWNPRHSRISRCAESHNELNLHSYISTCYFKYILHYSQFITLIESLIILYSQTLSLKIEFVASLRRHRGNVYTPWSTMTCSLLFVGPSLHKHGPPQPCSTHEENTPPWKMRVPLSVSCLICWRRALSELTWNKWALKMHSAEMQFEVRERVPDKVEALANGRQPVRLLLSTHSLFSLLNNYYISRFPLI